MGILQPVDRERSYRLRALLCLAGALAALIVLVRWWPTPDPSTEPDALYSAEGQELIEVDEIIPTRQQQAPPPPAPLPPVVVPNDAELEDVELDLTDSFLEVDDPDDDPEYVEGSPEAASGPSASTSARLVRVVEPEYPPEARRRNIQARLVLELTVNEAGEVEDIRIMERYLIEGDSEERVAHLGYGLEEAALEAARRVRYRPAMHEGEPVAEVTLYTITLGV